MTMKHKRRPDARPDEILDAALAAFSETGFAAARVEDVAARAGLSKGAVYLYFESKDAMLKALVRRFAEQVPAAAEAMIDASAEDDPEGALRAALHFFVAAISDPAVAAAPRLVLAEAQRVPEIAAMYRDEVIAIGRRAVERLLAAGVARGVFRDVDARIVMRAFAGPVLAHMMLTHVFAHPGEDAPSPGDVADAFADLVLYGLKPRAQGERS